MTDQVQVPKTLIEDLVSWVTDSADEHGRSDADIEDVLTAMAHRHGVSVRLLLGQEEFERPTIHRQRHQPTEHTRTTGGPRKTQQMKYRVQVAILTRQTAVVEVEAPEGADPETIKQLAWQKSEDPDTEWNDDTGWGCDEGTHTILGTVE